jgi:hypothetical protein
MLGFFPLVLKFSWIDFEAVMDFEKLGELRAFDALGALMSAGTRSHAAATRRRAANAVRD